jgi:hypothetical protein
MNPGADAPRALTAAIGSLPGPPPGVMSATAERVPKQCGKDAAWGGHR